MENKTELISCTRPAYERVLDEIRGTPKYFIGSSPSLNPRI
jgi:galactose-1-phosphate uridylyltransferase